MRALFITLILFIASAHSVTAVPIGSRDALQQLLGGPGTLEDFEALTIGSGTSVRLDCGVLDAAAICNGEGPGLVDPGLAILFAANGQLDGPGYFGAPSKEILTIGQPLIIDFLTFVDAFGVDLRAFVGFPAEATMNVFGPDDVTLIGSLSGIALSASGVPFFAGWEDLGGIGSVRLTQTIPGSSPIIDNVEFGGRKTVPEPASAALLTLAMVFLGSRRRSRSLDF